MSAAAPAGRISSVERAVDVLTLFTQVDRPDLGVTEIAAELSLSKAVVHRILTTLAAKGLVESDDTTRRYRLGPVALSLGATYIDRLDLRSLALPVLRQLSASTDETATLSLRYGWERMYVDQITPDREVKMTVPLGRGFPLHTGSSSKAFLAFLSDADIDAYLEGHALEPFTDVTVTDVTTLRTQLREIRARGYAVSFGERQAGAGSVAAPVLDHRKQPAAVVSLCGPLERFRDEVPTLTDALLTATSQLSRQLGHL